MAFRWWAGCGLVAALAGLAPAAAPLVAAAPAAAAKGGGAAGKGGAAAAIDPEAAKKAADELREQGQKSWDRAMKINNDVQELIKRWAPERMPSVKSVADEAEAVLKSLGGPEPGVKRPDLPFKLDEPTRRLSEVAAVDVPDPVPAATAATPKASERLRQGRALPAPQLPTGKAGK